jgi:hypothetical protein
MLMHGPVAGVTPGFPDQRCFRMFPYGKDPESHRPHADVRREVDDVPGIVIQDGGAGHLAAQSGPRVRAFVYGESEPALPMLPFGRWKVAS